MARLIRNMNNKDAVIKIAKLLLGVSIKIFSLIVGLYTMRWLNTNLNPSELKAFYLSIFFNASILGVATLGLSNLVNKFIVNKASEPYKFNNIWSNAFFVQLYISLFGILLVYIVSLTNPVLPFNILILVYITQMFLALDGSFKVVADYNNKTWLFTITELISKILIVSGLIVFVNGFFGTKGVLFYSLLILACAIVQFTLDLYFQSKSLTWVKPKFSLLKEYKTDIIQFTLIGFAIAISSTSDRWFLSYFKFSDFVINGYVNIYNLFSIAMIVETVIIPVLYYNMLKGKDINLPIKQIVLKSKWFYLILAESLLASVTFKIGSYIILPLIDKNGTYLNYSYEVVDILSFTLLFTSSNYFLSQILILKNKVKYETICVMIFMFLSILLYLILIPRYAHLGAAYATLISYSITLLIKIHLINKIN
jgi:O-antigen/teichoic acid export membrane protein